MSDWVCGLACSTPLDSIEYQQYERFEMSLEALAELSAVLPHQSYESALALWRGSLDKTTFQPNPHDSIQVLGPLEALGGRFDLWVCGAQQSTLRVALTSIRFYR